MANAAGAPRLPSIKESGPNHRVWETVTQIRDPSGQTRSVTNTYTELTSGLNFKRGGEWVETQELFLPAADGGVEATNGPHVVHINANLNTVAAVDFLASNNNRIRANLIGLGLYNPKTHESVVIAQVKDCIGELLPPNQMIFRDAFKGGPKADVIYTYRKAGLEQDVVLREKFDPAQYDMPEAVRLEVLTEILDSQAPKKRPRYGNPKANQPGTNAVPDIVDEDLDFGGAYIGPGSSFRVENAIPNGGGNLNRSVPIRKSFEKIANRDFLIEAVEFNGIKPQLQNLPLATAALRPKPNGALLAGRQVPSLLLTSASTNTLQLAQANLREELTAQPGVVLDFTMLDANSQLYSYVFRREETYYIGGNVYLNDQTTIESAVIKFERNSGLVFFGPVQCLTDPYNPAVLTAKDDNTIGATLWGLSSGTPTGTYAEYALYIPTIGSEVKHVRILYANWGIFNAGMTVKHAQFLHCATGFYTQYASGHLNAFNILMNDVGIGFAGSQFFAHAEHVTFNQGTVLSSGSGSTLQLVNSLLVGVGGYGTASVTTDHVENLPAGSPVFQAVGGGAHYLTPYSPYRNAGTTSIDPALANDLKKLTTDPPIALGNISTDTTLAPQAARDLDTPDLGYHATPLDYLACGVNVSPGVTVSLTGGAAVGIDYCASYWGFILNSAKFVSI